MKKILALILAVLMVVSLAACSNKPAASSSAASAYNSSLEVYTAMWDKVDEKFPVFGGNQNENAVSDAPGKFDMSDTDGLTYLLLLPESVQSKIDDVASMIHMMNANTFTSAVLHVKEGTMADIAKEIENTVMNNQFMCGFPEKLVIFSVGDYLFYAFGNGEAVDMVVNSGKANLQGEVSVLCDKPIE